MTKKSKAAGPVSAMEEGQFMKFDFAKRDPPADPAQAALEAIQKLVPRLSKEGARTAMLLLAATNKDNVADAGKTDWLLEGIRAEMKRRGLRCPPFTPKFVNKDVLAQAAGQRESIEQSLRRSGSSLSTTQWLALGKACAKALARMLENWQVKDETTQTSKPVPFSLRLMLRHIGRVTEALDADFPGYLEAGLVHMVVQVRDPDADDDKGTPITPEDAKQIMSRIGRIQSRSEVPSAKEHIDEYADGAVDDDAGSDDDGKREGGLNLTRLPSSFEAWNERREAEQEAEAKLARSFNRKLLGHDPPPPSPPDDFEYDDEYGEDDEES